MPPPADASEVASLVLAIVILLAAVFLGWWQWRDYRVRPTGLSRLDDDHFGRQDMRRALGTIVLLLLAVALFVGGRMPHEVAGKANLKFVQVWAGAAFLVVVLLILAMLDWFSTRLYATRHRERLAKEGLSIVEAELRIKTAIRRAETQSDRDTDDA